MPVQYSLLVSAVFKAKLSDSYMQVHQHFKLCDIVTEFSKQKKEEDRGEGEGRGAREAGPAHGGLCERGAAADQVTSTEQPAV